MAATTTAELQQCREDNSDFLSLRLSDDEGVLNGIVRNLPYLSDLVTRVEIPYHSSTDSGYKNPNWTDSDKVEEVFEAIGELEQLQSATIRADTSSSNFPIDLVAHVLLPAKTHLKYLTFDVPRLQCSFRSITKVAKALEQMTSLQVLKLRYTILFNTGNALDYGAVDPILASLRKIPSLQCVTLNGWATGSNQSDRELLGSRRPTFDADSFGELLKSESLQELHISRIDLSFDCIMALAGAIQSNTSRLRKLILDDFPQDPQVQKCLAMAFTNNNTLETIGVSHSAPMEGTDNFLSMMAGGLVKNTGLTTLRISPYPLSQYRPKIQEAFVEALKVNTSLTSLHVAQAGGRSPENYPPALLHYLKLNQMKRKGFLEKDNNKISHAEWVDKMVEASHDLDAFYYFLRLNPSLCPVVVKEDDSGDKAATPESEEKAEPEKDEEKAELELEVERLKKELEEKKAEVVQENGKEELEMEVERLKKELEEKADVGTDEGKAELEMEVERLKKELDEKAETGQDDDEKEELEMEVQRLRKELGNLRLNFLGRPDQQTASSRQVWSTVPEKKEEEDAEAEEAEEADEAEE